ncbi:hypothetical protein Hanom_Chr02g00103591 [Helianthus anomalus]
MPTMNTTKLSPTFSFSHLPSFPPQQDNPQIPPLIVAENRKSAGLNIHRHRLTTVNYFLLQKLQTII